MTKKQQSIWTKDITPHVVGFMTMDITPDFSGEIWTQDITHIVIGSLAVFGLVVSSLVTTAGVAAAGVNVELAFAQQESVASQTASVVLADSNRPVPPPMPAALGSTTSLMASSTAMFCPKIARTVMRGNHDATTTGDIGQLQQFMAEHFNMDTKDVVTGFFGSTTQGLLMRFQEEQGIPPTPQAGPLTRAAIARLCNPTSHDNGSLLKGNGGDHGMGSTTMGSTTPPMPPRHDDFHPSMGSTTVGSSTMPHREDIEGSSTEHHGPMMPPPPPKAPTPTTTPVTYYNNASNSASVLEAINEIGDGYGRLLTASLSMLGL